MLAALLLASVLLPAADAPRQTVIVVVGAAGTEEYGANFAAWADRWASAADRAGARLLRVGPGSKNDPSGGEATDRSRLEALLRELAEQPAGLVWLVMIGHGTFDGQQAKFNLRGPDATADDLAAWLQPIESPLAVVNCASASGPFLNKLSAPGRVIVTATKSGPEHNYARFGEYMSAAVADDRIDLDKDGQTSLLEAYLAASSRAAEFYDQQRRLATEHALLDDNGDSLGTPADWFRGFRAVRTAKEGAAVDGQRAAQFVLVRKGVEATMSEEERRQRDDLERQVAELRSRKSVMEDDQYYRQLEPLLLALARLYRDAEAASAEPTESNSPAEAP